MMTDEASRYVPAYCAACESAFLQPAVGSTSTCPSCDATTRVIPGAVYGRDDLPVFAEIEAAVHAAKVTDVEAMRISEQLERASLVSNAPADTLELLSARIPSLPLLGASWGSSPSRIARGMGMLLTAVSARKPALHQKASEPPQNSSVASRTGKKA